MVGGKANPEQRMTDVPHLVRARLNGERPEEHPDANVLTAFAEQLLPEAERGPVVAHLSACADCRDVVALALPAMQSQQVSLAAPEKAWRLPTLRWAAVAACFLVVGAAVLFRDRTPQVGMRTDGDATLPATNSEPSPQ